MEKTLKALTKLPSKMGKIADVVNNIIDHIKNGGGGGGGVDFTPGKPLELTANKVLRLDKNYVLSPFKVDNNGYIRLALDNLHLEENDDEEVNIHADNILYLNALNDMNLYSDETLYLTARNEMYLTTYNNSDIYLNSAGGIYLNSNNGNDIALSSDSGIVLGTNNKSDIDLNSNGAIYLSSNNNYNVTINSDAGIYLSTSKNEIYLDSYSNINLYSNNEFDIVINSNNGIELVSENSDINLSSNNAIILATDNESEIQLESNGAIYLYSDNECDIEISSDANLLLYSKNNNYIELGVRNSDYTRNLILNGGTGGLEYNQDGNVYFKIDDNGHIIILDSDGDTVDLTDFVFNQDDIVIPFSSTQLSGEYFILIVTTRVGEQRIKIDENTRNITISYDANYPHVIIDFDEGASSFTSSDLLYFEKYSGRSIKANCTTTTIIPDITKINKITTSIQFCYTADTLITLADGTTKQVKDITYDDELKVWNFDEGKDDVAKPLWIKRTEHAKSYQLVTLSDGNTIKFCGNDDKYHCMFDVTEQKFNHAVDCIGHKVYTENGIVTVVSIEEVKEKVDHYNIVTNYHMNLYANHILTSTEKNNIYPIANMKFVKDDRKIVPYEEFEKAHISREYYDGWRAGEWNEPLKDVITHLRRRKIYAKPQKSVKNGLRTDYFG